MNESDRERLIEQTEYEIAAVYNAMSNIQSKRAKLDAEYERFTEDIARLRGALNDISAVD